MRTLFFLLILILSGSTGVSQTKMSASLASLVEAERTFARTSVEKGVRASFIEFFAEEGVVFQPTLANAKEMYTKRPAPLTKPPVTLNWEPAYADISAAGDLGYTTGPFVFTDESPQKRPPRYGFYFSIWRKHLDGTWKVLLDCGIDTPDHSGQSFVLRVASRIKPRQKTSRLDPEIERSSLINLDRKLLKALSNQGMLAYLDYLDADSRLHRPGLLPLIGYESIRSYLSKDAVDFKGEPIKSEVSQSGDMGYTYGSYELKSSGMTESEKGYYVRLWKRDQKNTWKIVLDTLSRIPKPNLS